MGTFKDSLKKWFYTNNTSAASSDARVPLLDNNGNPKGSDTTGNLASVLSGLLNSIRTDIQDLNDVPEGFHAYCIEPDRAAGVLHAPVNQWGVLITMYISTKQYPMGAQIFIPVLMDRFFFRNYYQSGGWRTWQELQKV